MRDALETARKPRGTVRKLTRGILCSLALLAAPVANRCEPPPPTCSTNADCSSTQYCNTPAGTCGATGTCQPRPEACTDIFDPVCGCDGKTYSSACFASVAGASVASKGQCPQFCGGIAGIQCPVGFKCVDNPNDSCDPNKGGADCGGICVAADPKVTCGGFAGLPCPGGGACVDDPTDGCDPNNGGADCGGICICRGPAPCPLGTVWDGSPSVCACKPAPCGSTTCGAGQYCCNASCGICAPIGAACIQGCPASQ